MLVGVDNFLYRNPHLYDAVYPDIDHEIPRLWLRTAAEHLDHPLGSVLDVGCGTGRDLGHLTDVAARVGIDTQEQMLAYARQTYPEVSFRRADMRLLSLGQQFDLVACMGFALAYLHDNADLELAAANFAQHTTPGGILIVELINAIADPRTGNLPTQFRIDVPGCRATAQARYHLDRRFQLLARKRTWSLEDGRTEHDYVRFRLLFPAELAGYLQRHGFEVLDMFDNTQGRPTELDGPRLFAVARRRPA